MPKTFIQDELQILIPKITEIRNKAIEDAKTFSLAYDEKGLRDDARPNAVRHFLNVLEGTNLSLLIMATSMDDPGWWKKVAGRPLAPEEVRFSIKAFYEATRVSLIQLLVSVVDTLFRRLLRAIEPGACKDATGEFQSIYKCLFKRLDSMPSEGEELLELLRLIRNTIHTNGYHYPRSGQNETIIWRGHSFHFNVGQPVAMPWELLLDAADGIRTLILDVINDPKIDGYSGLITV